MSVELYSKEAILFCHLKIVDIFMIKDDATEFTLTHNMNNLSNVFINLTRISLTDTNWIVEYITRKMFNLLFERSRK